MDEEGVPRKEDWDIGQEAGRVSIPGARKGCMSRRKYICGINCYSEVTGTENLSEARYFTIRRSSVTSPTISQSLASSLISSQVGIRKQRDQVQLISHHPRVN